MRSELVREALRDRIARSDFWIESLCRMIFGAVAHRLPVFADGFKIRLWILTTWDH